MGRGTGEPENVCPGKNGMGGNPSSNASWALESTFKMLNFDGILLTFSICVLYFHVSW